MYNEMLQWEISGSESGGGLKDAGVRVRLRVQGKEIERDNLKPSLIQSFWRLASLGVLSVRLGLLGSSLGLLLGLSSLGKGLVHDGSLLGDLEGVDEGGDETDDTETDCGEES